MMHTLHECLLRFCIWWLKFDLAVARSTGRDLMAIAQASIDLTRMETDLHRLRLNRNSYNFTAKRQQLIDEGDI